MAYIIGISGPCGSGKSTLSKELKKAIPSSAILHFDDILRSIALNPRFIARLIQIYGFKIFKKGGINDGLLTLKRQNFERIYEFAYPMVFEKIKKRIAKFSKVNSTIILDFFILPRTGFWDMCDKTILLDAPADIRHEQVSIRDGFQWSKEELIGMDENIGVDYDNCTADIKIDTEYVPGFFSCQAQRIVKILHMTKKVSTRKSKIASQLNNLPQKENATAQNKKCKNSRGSR